MYLWAECILRMECYKDVVCPTKLSRAQHPHYVEILKDTLTASYSGRGAHTDVGAVRSDIPAPLNCPIYYFEVKILQCGATPKITIGVTRKHSLLTRPPGSEKRSVGYRSEDGRKLRNARSLGEAYGPPYGQGDVVGCGLHYSQNNIFFTKNGVSLGAACGLRPAEYYPTAGMHILGESVGFNFSGPFVFDLEGFVQEELLSDKARIAKEECERSVLDNLVRSYLLHAGYQDTLIAFDAAIGKSSHNSLPSSTTTNNGKERSETSRRNERDLEGKKTSFAADSSIDTQEAAGAKDRSCSINDSRTVTVNTASESENGTLVVRENGMKNSLSSWEAFELNAVVEQKLLATLPSRKQLRDLIFQGKILDALQLLQFLFPHMMNRENDSVAEALLLSQQMIEYMRGPTPNVEKAVEWMRTALAPYRDSSTPIDEIISSCCSLISYPDSISDKMSQMFDISRNALVADAINEHILKNESKAPEWAPLHLLIRQLVACKLVLRESTGDYGTIPTARLFCQPFTKRHRKPLSTNTNETSKTM